MQEIEECINIKEPISLQVRLTAIGSYALMLHELGQNDKAIYVAKSALNYQPIFTDPGNESF